MKEPLVSVILSSYNGGKTLSMVLDSLLGQSYRNTEIILVNDASKDNTLKIMQEYQKKYKNIKIIDNEVNLERCKSRNEAIKISKGKYIAIADDDDEQFPKRLMTEVNYLENNSDVYLVSSRAKKVDPNGKFIKLTYGENQPIIVDEELMMKRNPIVHSTIMFRNTKEYWYREMMKIAEDFDLYLQMLSDGRKLVILPDILINYLDWAEPTSEYRFKQIKVADIARTFYKERVKDGKDKYYKLTNDNMDRFVSEKIKQQLLVEDLYWSGKYPKSVIAILKYMSIYGLSKNLLIYLIDSLSFGFVRRTFILLKK